MASTCTLYTMGHMVGADIDAATSEATGYPKENVVDNNPDTYWKATSTASQTLDFDLQEAKQVDGFMIFLRNYASVTDAEYVGIAYSDNGSDWTTISSAGLNVFDKTIPVLTSIYDCGSHRYYRLACGVITTILEISMVAFLTTRAITIGNQWPEDDTDVFFNREFKSSDGRNLVAGVNSRSFKEFSRKYLISGDTNWTALRNAHQDSRGSLLPLVLNEGTLLADAKLVRFVDPKLSKNQRDYQYYNPTVRFKEIPYYPDGESY